ncbi:MAG: citrate lyase subunit alpha [Ezakiella sp.]|uniref:citrate lyase subunit alpha n=1 Tax=Ezakiella sp. TaxID=1935205 RepID=UPI0029724D13|nr:citrate lyase subunit alpha [Ezakiella sp.]MDD7731475.1 citrate lyase subunit alpha [Eubacteriales bacterium]MDY6079290.1 citrate lyase subunit alpha [Ezakiella sp.]
MDLLNKDMSAEFKPVNKLDKENKMVQNISELFDKLEIKDGATLSFHHHLRNGDFVLNMVFEEVKRRGIKDITLVASSIFPCHEPIVPLIKDGTIKNVITSYMSGPVAESISHGDLKGTLVMQSHGGRARAIMEGSVKIDVAFIGAPATDVHGNISATEGKAFCGTLGYAIADSIMAEKTVAITDTILELEGKTEIPSERIDYILKVDSIGDPNGIISGTTRITKDPVGLRIAQKAVEVMVATGLVKEGMCYQSGAGGVSLAVTKFLGDYMEREGIKGKFASGGVTGDLCDMKNRGLFDRIYDVQCFDLKSAEDIKNDPRHITMSAEKYASPYKDAIVNSLDFVILGATELDTDFNVNVTTGHDGVIMGGSGGHQDTAYGAKVSIIVSKLFQSRIPLIVDRVGVISTPGSTVDVLVTERGVAVNENRKDIIEALKAHDIEVMTIKELKELSDSLTGVPEKKRDESKRVIGYMEYRDGQVLDKIYQA